MENFKAKFPLLHAIRGVAALYVVVYHAKFILWSGGTEYLNKYPRSSWSLFDYSKFVIDLITTAGSQMVLIFFVLSGFFIAMSLENSKGSFGQRVKLFYLVRVIRIYIPYIASIIIGVGVLLWIQQFVPELYHTNVEREFNNRLVIAYNNLNFSNFIKSLSFLKNKEYIGFNFAYWSLLYEGIFYLIIPFAFQKKKVYFFISILLFVSGIFVTAIYQPSNIMMRYLFEYNIYFALGQFIYLYKGQILDKFDKKYYKIVLLISGFFLFFLFDVLALLKQQFWSGVLSGIAVFCFIIVFLKYDFKNTWLIKGVIKLGKVSYSLYLVHIPVLVFIYSLVFLYKGELIFYSRVWYFSGVLISVCVGVLLYKIAEKPSMKLIKRIKKKFKE